MKKIFTKPEINIKSFAAENVVTSSSGSEFSGTQGTDGSDYNEKTIRWSSLFE